MTEYIKNGCLYTCTIDKELNFCKLIGKKNTETKLSWDPTLSDRHHILILHDTLVLVWKPRPFACSIFLRGAGQPD